ncbi:MAG TPA: hypothetical protein VHO29_05135, partial [Marmoricola sp.]|nr:hypothetical protein [Marmoricola sp.]
MARGTVQTTSKRASPDPRRRDAQRGCHGFVASQGPARERSRRLPLGLFAAVGIDLLLDGLLVGLGVRLGTAQAVVLTVALTLEISFLMLSVAGGLRDAGFGAAAATGLCTGLGAVTAVGAIGGALVFGGVGPAGLAFVLA